MFISRITSTNNNLVKHIVKIREDLNYRNKYELVLVSGRKMVAELAKIARPQQIFVLNSYEHGLSAPEIFEVSLGVLKKLSGLVNPEEIVAVFELPKPSLLDNKKRVLICESIADPGNLGTLMRTALALDLDGIFILGRGVDPFHEKVLRASRGALFSLCYEIGNWQRLQELTRNKRSLCYTAHISGEPIHNVKSSEEFFLLMSNESQGPSHEAHNFGQKLSVPISAFMESLNVSIAGAILMYGLTHANFSKNK